MASARAADVWPTVCRHLRGFFAGLQEGELVLRDNSLLMLSGGPTADFNMAVLEAGDETVLRDFATRVRTAGVQALFMLPAQTGGRIAQVASDEGLAEAGTAPVMLLDQPPAAPTRGPFSVERVEDTAGLSEVASLIASAFSLDREWVGTTFAAPAQLDNARVQFWLASREGEPYSTVTFLSSGDNGLVGIWNMGTAPEHQRQGAGRAVLEAAMHHHSLSGNKRFYLISTPAGQPLYDATGFRTIAEVSVYVAGHSAQFADH